jgi:hypothetical protein
MNKNLLLEEITKKISKKIITERKTDDISLALSRFVINQFKNKEDFELQNIHFERGNDYANFDFFCYFIEDKTMEDPFSVRGSGDMQEIEIEITYNPDEFPKSMNDLVAEVKETIEHELEHVEQQNFDDMHVKNDEEYDEEDEEYNFKYLTSNVEIPAYVRGLIKRSKTKKISLEDAMDEWFEENKRKFKNPKKEWKKVKEVWLDYANKMRTKERVKKFK